MTRTYQTMLRAKGIKPIPRIEKLRTLKKAGDLELCSGGIVYLHSGEGK